jgi:predicted amidohydrolase YtcJ
VKTLFRAARVHTLGHPPLGEWVLVDGRHIQRVGAGDPPNADRVVELPGCTILPGFIDAHVHLTSVGAATANDDVAAVGSRRELLAIAAARADDDTERVVSLQGYDESRWSDPTLPSLAELDAITSEPLVIRRTDGHVALVNSAALTFAEALDTPGVDRDTEGRPTGLVTREANRQVGLWVASSRTVHRIEELQLLGAGVAATHGVTAVHEMALPLESGMRDVDVLLAHRARLPVAVEVVLGTMDVPKAVELDLAAIGGDLAADGSIGARTAALTHPYADRPEAGVTYFDDEVLEGFFHDGHEAGLQVGMHAIGDRAIEQVLRAWESVYHRLDSRERRHFRARRHRIEHFEMPTAEHVERAAMLGLAVSMQPTFDLEWGQPGGLYAQGVGADRAHAMNPVRLLLDRGVVVGVGSDAPVVPMDPWLTIHALEHHHDPTQRLTRAESIRLHTAGSARLAHQEEKKGVLEPGMHADLVVYDADPLTVEDVRTLQPTMTVSLGREVWLA